MATPLMATLTACAGFLPQDAFSLYLGLEHCPNGELYDQIRLKGRLGEEAACFYAGEVVLMLEHLREHAVVSHVCAFGAAHVHAVASRAHAVAAESRTCHTCH